MRESEPIEIERISELVESQSIFTSTSVSRLKVIRNGKTYALEIPIKSTGLEEYREKLRDKAPRPPVFIETYKKGSKEALEFNSNTDVKVCKFDFTDVDYIDANDAYVREFPWKLAVFAIDCPLKMADGSIAETYEDKKRVLMSNGITGKHLDQIAIDVRNLSEFNQEQEDFLLKS
jgi:hypothetical protein